MNKVIILIIVIIILGGIVYWISNTGSDKKDLAGEGDACSEEKECESQLECNADLICSAIGVSCETTLSCKSPLVCLESALWTCQPAPIVYFDLQEWELLQTHHLKDGTQYTTSESNHGTYGDAWGLRLANLNYNPRLQIYENVTFPPANTSFKFEIIWKDHGKNDPLVQSTNLKFYSNKDNGGFFFQRINNKASVFVYRSDNTPLIFAPLSSATEFDQLLTMYREVFTYNVNSREYNHEHFEGDDLTTRTDVDDVINGTVPVDDGEWGYTPGSTPRYTLESDDGHEILYMRLSGI